MLRWYAPYWQQSRLVPQPGGFERLVTVGELVYTHDLVIAQRVDLVEAGLNCDSACSAPAPEVRRDENAIARVDELLRVHLQVVPRAREALKVVSDRRSAVRRALLDGVHDEVRREVGHCILAAAAEHLVLPGAAYDLHVLIRHRPQYPGSDDSASRRSHAV